MLVSRNVMETMATCGLCQPKDQAKLVLTLTCKSFVFLNFDLIKTFCV